jgi:hypothetical protein
VPIQERIILTEEKLQSWLLNSKTLREALPPNDERQDHQDHAVNEALTLNAGDVVWLSRRQKAPRVRVPPI